MNKKIGFIGCGNMGSAMAKGIANSGIIENENILLFDPNKDALNSLSKDLNATAYSNEKEVAQEADYLVLAVKPYIYPEVLEKIKNNTKKDQTVIVIAVGVSFEDIKEKIGDVKVARVQPSTPALVGESDTTFCTNSKVTKEEEEELLQLFNTFGKTEILSENLMDVVPSIASSAPAYALMLISAMADGGVLNGFPRDQAIRLSAQSVLGAAKMVLETEESPDVLKDKICTPGGTTIEAVCKLEEKGFNSAVIEAVKACADKSKKMLEK